MVRLVGYEDTALLSLSQLSSLQCSQYTRVYFSHTLLLVPCSSSRVGRLYNFDCPLRFDNICARFCSELALDVTAYAEDIRNILLHTARKDQLSSIFSFYTAFDF
jgi:hypothetical protein